VPTGRDRPRWSASTGRGASTPTFCWAPSATTELVRELARAGGDLSVLYSHADVIPEVLRDLMVDGMQVGGARGCAMGSVWELDVEQGRITDGRYLAHPGHNR